MADRSAPGSTLLRFLLAAVFVVLPLTSLWNLTADPRRGIHIGPKLGGVTEARPEVALSWATIADGSFQRALGTGIAEAFALRPLLINLNNSIRFELFGDYPHAYVVRGAKGHLFGRIYLDEYCARTVGEGARLAADVLPKLQTIQNYYRASGGVFVYLISPSKAAHFPEYFAGRYRCPSSPEARARLIPEYVAALKAAGINVVDAASLIHARKGQYEVPLFPEGGEHWNDIGGALAVSALVEEINRQAGRELVPPFKYSYALSNTKDKADRELADLLNVFFPPLGFMTAKVKYEQPATCEKHPASDLEIAMVGSSFGYLPSQVMIENNCLTRLDFYYYLKLGRFGGQPYRELQRDLTDAEIARVRDAKVMILEENEHGVGRTNYTTLLRDVVAR
jgi:alginate O-acetyltransferase complex protein AlgJ